MGFVNSLDVISCPLASTDNAGIIAKDEPKKVNKDIIFNLCSSLTSRFKIPPNNNTKNDIIKSSIFPRANVKLNFLQDSYSPNKSKKQVLY